MSLGATVCRKSWNGSRARPFFLSAVSKHQGIGYGNGCRGIKGLLQADINVTPLVDVMLVLLIIMMLIAPMLHHYGAIMLPEAGNSTEKPDTQYQTVVAIDSRSMFYVNAIPVTPDDLVPRVQRALEHRNEKPVYVKGDKDAK